MEVQSDLYDFGQELLDNFDKERAQKILREKTKLIENKLDEEEDSLLKPSDKDKLGDKYDKWDKIDQTILKREQFEQKAEKDKSDLNKNLMEQMMGCDQNHSKELNIYNRPFEEKIEVIKDFKDKGNKYFKEDDLQKASYFYEQALLQFHYLIPDNKEEEDIVNPLHLNCHLNKALVLYKLKRYQEGIENTYQALNIDSKSVKGYYRQALCNRALDEFDKATEDVTKGLEIDPNNKALKELQKTLKEDIKNYIKQSKKVYGKMMEGEPGSQSHPEESPAPNPDQFPTNSESLEESKIPKNVTPEIIPPNSPKVVELGPDEDPSDTSEDGSEHNVYELKDAVSSLRKDLPTDTNDDRYNRLEARLSKVEEIVQDIKFSMDVLKGYGAIPNKMPTDEEKEEIERRNGSNKSNKSHRSTKDEEEIAPRRKRERDFSWDIGVIAGILLIMLVIAISTSEFLIWLRTSPPS